MANHDSIFAYDSDWRLVNTISHPQFADIHEIEAVGDSIWVTSAGIDAVLKVTSSGEIVEGHYLGELAPEARSELGIGGRQVDHGADYREQLSEIGSHVAHPNGLCLSGGQGVRNPLFLWRDNLLRPPRSDLAGRPHARRA